MLATSSLASLVEMPKNRGTSSDRFAGLMILASSPAVVTHSRPSLSAGPISG